MKTKGIDIFCSSNSATSICLNIMDEPSASSSSSSSLSAGRAIDRHNPIIRDPRRLGSSPARPPINHPKPQNNQNRTRKIGFSKPKNESKKKNSSYDLKKKGIAEPIENKMVMRNGWSCTKPGDFISPPGSSRYLLGSGDHAFVDMPPDFDQKVVKFVPIELDKSFDMETDESFYAKPPPSSRPPDQVVVLRVSLHCKGCERKMRKHLSRMEGVSSFDIDFAAKKVTVVGNVSPLEVVTSISKVKNAKLWMPPTQLSSPSPLCWSNVQLQKYQEATA